MQATLIYNDNAGSARGTSRDALERALHEAGFEPVYEKTERESDLDEVLAQPRGLVVAAGGDGTVRGVAKRLIGTEGAALAVVPMGTANNIAHAFGIKGKPEAVVSGLASAQKRPLDVGRVRAPWGEDYFLEAAGWGLFADLLADYDPEEGKSVLRAADTIKDVLADYEARAWRFSLDGRDLSNRYVAVEVMNTKATGPRLKLAPEADPCDGRFDLACVLEPEHTSLLDYLGSLLTDSFPGLDNVEMLRGERLELHWQGDPLHIDEDLRPGGVTERDEVEKERGGAGTVKIEILPGAIELWLPELA